MHVKEIQGECKITPSLCKDVWLVIISADDQGTCDISTVYDKAKATSLHLNGIKSSEQ